MDYWGPVDVLRHARLKAQGIHLRIFRFNVDVTDRCRFFDDTPGHEMAELYLLDQGGRQYLDAVTQSVALEVINNFEIRQAGPLH